MSDMSNYLEESLLNAICRGQTYEGAPVIYVALYTTAPTDNDLGMEVSGAGYVRQAVTFSEPSQVVGKATIENTEDVVFPVASSDWGTVTHVGIRDAETGGNLLFHKEVNNPRTILTNDRVRFLQGEIKIDLS